MSNKPNKQKPLVLVDGSSYLYRAFHAMPGLSNSKGQATGAVYGVINMLKRLLNDYDPEHVAVVFDAKGKTFRDDLFAEYKANRPPMPDELRGQIEPLHEAIKAMGFPLIIESGVEADDVIGTLAVEACKAGMSTLVSTGDKDMAQLVNDHVTLVDTMKGQVTDREGVIEKFGVPPELIIDYLALIGDKVDNIPGVPKCGPKTAVKWLQEYGSLKGVMENADKIKGKVGENLRNSLEQLPLSYELATIRCDVELHEKPGELTLKAPDTEALKRIYSELEFKTWLSQLLGDGDSVASSETEAAPEIEADYEIVSDWDAFERWQKALNDADLFAFDTETTSLNYTEARIVGVSFAIEPGKAAYVPLIHEDVEYPNQLDREQVLSRLKPLLEDANKAKLGHNLKYDMNVLANHGIELAGIAYDSMLESYVLESTASRHNLDDLALKYLSYKTIHFEDIAGKGAKQLRFDEIPVEKAAPYAAEDADISLRLHQCLWPKLEQQPSLEKLFKQVELPVLTVLSKMERRGVLIDCDLLHVQSSELQAGLQQIEQQAYDSAGQSFNLGSPKQIQEILFEKQGLPVIAKTPKGAPSTAESVLEELALEHELPRLILEYRSMAKLKSTYTDKLPLLVDENSRVHTSYNQAVAATGRLSSTEPNLQNIPVRKAEGRRIRQAFIAPEGNKIVAADYSQIELRIMAHLSQDQGLLDAFAEGKDIHRATSAEIFGVSEDEVTSDMRRSAKAINFGLIYGMSAFGLAKQLNITRGEAQEYVNTYFERYPGVREYMDNTRELAKEQGYVETVFGRRLYIPDINSRNGQRRQYAERTAINAPMQGSAADIIKRAMLAVDDWLAGEPDIGMIMQVHDELVFEIPESKVDAASKKIEQLMAAAAELSVPLEVGIGVGDNWDEAH